MSGVSVRSQQKETFWRSHLDRQRLSGESIRGYCRVRKLSEALFHFWRREIARRDLDTRAPRRSDNPGLIAVNVVGEPTLRSPTPPLLEIECPGGPLIRLREEAPIKVLLRVMRVCRMDQEERGPAGSQAVRSC
jgi:hypothetical protein